MVATPDRERVVRRVVSGLVALIVLFAQAGTVFASANFASAPHHAVSVNQHAAQTELTQAGRSHHPATPCSEHGGGHGATCCLSAGCHGIAGWPMSVPSAAPQALA